MGDRDAVGAWAEDGLPFRCTACGDCCTGEPGAVWVNQAEIERLAALLELSPADFEARYVRRLAGRRTLFEHFDGDCVLFDPETRRCRVYAARPTQCRTWPFWPQHLVSPEAWREVVRACPGAGEGDVVPIERIRAQVDELRRAREQP